MLLTYLIARAAAYAGKPCQLDMWHLPQPAGTLPPGKTSGYVSANGHFFDCTHGHGSAGSLCHTYFIIDRSGSMAATDVRPSSPQLTNASSYSIRYLDNKLGAVYEAMLAYTNIWRSSSPGDLVSFVAFDHAAHMAFSQQAVGDDMLSHMLAVWPGGSTHFTCGLHLAFQQLQQQRAAQHSNPTAAAHQPVFILLTDSEAHDRDQTVRFLEQAMLQEAGRSDAVKLHALGFGKHVDNNFMAEIATVGNGSFHTITNSDDVGRSDALRTCNVPLANAATSCPITLFSGAVITHPSQTCCQQKCSSRSSLAMPLQDFAWCGNAPLLCTNVRICCQPRFAASEMIIIMYSRQSAPVPFMTVPCVPCRIDLLQSFEALAERPDAQAALISI